MGHAFVAWAEEDDEKKLSAEAAFRLYLAKDEEEDDFEQAVEYQRDVLTIADEEARDKLRARLQLYEAGRPYREDPAGQQAVE